MWCPETSLKTEEVKVLGRTMYYRRTEEFYGEATGITRRSFRSAKVQLRSLQNAMLSIRSKYRRSSHLYTLIEDCLLRGCVYVVDLNLFIR